MQESLRTQQNVTYQMYHLQFRTCVRIEIGMEIGMAHTQKEV
jgi:hypothetical protein